jgi:hypothetical protein
MQEFAAGFSRDLMLLDEHLAGVQALGGGGTHRFIDCYAVVHVWLPPTALLA